MIIEYIIFGIVGALVVGYLFGGWYLIDEWKYQRWLKKQREEESHDKRR